MVNQQYFKSMTGTFRYAAYDFLPNSNLLLQ